MLDPVTDHTATGARRPVRIGALAPLTRPGFREAGRHLRAGIELAIAEINDAGGIGGRPLELLLRDTAGTPPQAAAAIRDFAAAGAVAVTGEYHSVVAHAAASAAVRAGLPFVCSSAVLDDLADAPDGLVARVAPAQSYCWDVYAGYLAAAGHGHVALVVQPDRYWSSGARLLHDALAKHGITVTRIDHATLAGGPAADLLAGADALLLLVAYPEPAASLVRAVRADARLSGLRIGDPAGRAEFPEWLALLGADGADVPFLRYRPARLGSPGERVAGRLAGLLGPDPSFVALEGYDSVQVAAAALRAGGPDRRRFAEALRGLQVTGTRGTISFSPGPGGVLQWTWPPVQVAARPDPRQPAAISVLHQQGS